MKDSIESRFWARVDTTAGLTGCWTWTGGHQPKGYGVLGKVGAHRFAYELAHGPIPAGLTIDHLCRNRGCVNPAHLEAVTNLENSRRGLHGVLRTHCKRGHAMDAANTYHGRKLDWPTRECRACHREKAARRRAKAGKLPSKVLS